MGLKILKIFILVFSLILPFSVFAVENKALDFGYERIVTVKETANLRRFSFPVSFNVELQETNGKDIRVFSKDNKEIPFLLKSIKGDLYNIKFLVDLKEKESKTFYLRYKDSSLTELPRVSLFDYTAQIFEGTKFIAPVKKELYVVSTSNNNNVSIKTKENIVFYKDILQKGTYKRFKFEKENVVEIISSKPLFVYTSTITEKDSSKIKKESLDDITSLSGCDLYVYSLGQIWIGNYYPSNNIEVTYQNRLIEKRVLQEKEISFLDGLEVGFYRIKSDKPVSVQAGFEDDNIYTTCTFLKDQFTGVAFGELRVLSLYADTNVEIKSLKNPAKKWSLPFKEKGEIASVNVIEKFEPHITEFEPVYVKTNKPVLLYNDGNSGNFGGEQIPTVDLKASGTNFDFLTGKVYNLYSKGHKREISIIALNDKTEINVSFSSSKQEKFLLDSLNSKNLSFFSSFERVEVTSNKDIVIFENGENDSENLLIILPLEDKSVEITVSGENKIVPGVTKPPPKESPKEETPVKPTPTGGWFENLKERFSSFINTLKTFLTPLFKNIKGFFIKVIQDLKIKEVFKNLNQKIEPFISPVLSPLSLILLPVVQKIFNNTSITYQQINYGIFYFLCSLILILFISFIVPKGRKKKKGRVKIVPIEEEKSFEFGLKELPLKGFQEEKIQPTRIKVEEKVKPEKIEKVVAPFQEVKKEPFIPVIPEIKAEEIKPSVPKKQEEIPIAEEAPPSLKKGKITQEMEKIGGIELLPIDFKAGKEVKGIKPIQEAELQKEVIEIQETKKEKIEEEVFEISRIEEVREKEAAKESSYVEPEAKEEKKEEITKERGFFEEIFVESSKLIEEIKEKPRQEEKITEEITYPQKEVPGQKIIEEKPREKPPVIPKVEEARVKYIEVPQISISELVKGGIVLDSQSLLKLFRAGNRSILNRAAISAKDLANISEDIRRTLKLTVLALSPIELHIAEDLSKRWLAPSYFGEALLVAKKMGYENYITSFENPPPLAKETKIFPIEIILRQPHINEGGEKNPFGIINFNN